MNQLWILTNYFSVLWGCFASSASTSGGQRDRPRQPDTGGECSIRGKERRGDALFPDLHPVFPELRVLWSAMQTDIDSPVSICSLRVAEPGAFERRSALPAKEFFRQTVLTYHEGESASGTDILSRGRGSAGQSMSKCA